ncbi:MAG: SNG1 family protein [Actinomycetota bacterium]|nr:SNG1 family protein [Actinomycetota bacterium]
MIDRPTLLRAGAAILTVTVFGLAFIASYAGALHRPRAHDIPIAVFGPDRLAEAVRSAGALKVVRERDEASTRAAVDERRAYGAVLGGEAGIEVVVAPAASLPIAEALRGDLATRLARAGPVRVAIVHRLPADDARGVVGFYVAAGWVVAGYLGATLLGLAFGTRPGRLRVVWRLAGVAALGLLMGLWGAVLAQGIGGLGGSLLGLAAVGMLTVTAVGWVTVGLQAVFGVLGTGVAILLFVVLGNPSSGGPFAPELLPGFWRTIGGALPTGASVSAVRELAYFPAASIGGALLVLLAWAVAGGVAALAAGSRPTARGEAEVAFAAAAAP